MTWLSWRQFRFQAAVAAAALGLAAVYLLYLGGEVRDAYDAARGRCSGRPDCGQVMSDFQNAYRNTLLFVAAGLGLGLALLGTFWGAPLVARELEGGTHRLVWNQSVTRRRWFLVKLLVVAVSAAVLAAAASALITWAADPVDQVARDRFSAVLFGSRGVAPAGYAVFGCVFGAVAGLLVRRTLPAMVITLITFIAVQFLVPNLVRPHFLPPDRASLPMTAEVIDQAQSLGSIGGGAVIKGLTVPGQPGAWVSHTSELRTADGRDLSDDRFNACLNHAPKTGASGTFGDTAVCLGKLRLHVDVEYQPAGRYWALQGIETLFYLLLSLLLAAAGLWRIRRVS